MIAAFAYLALLSPALTNDRGLQLMKQMAEALKNAKTVELKMEGESPIDNKLMKAHVKGAVGPIRYWARLDTAGEGTEYAALDGKTMRYTGSDGKRVQREVPSHRVAVNNASSTGFYAWTTFLNPERLASLSVDNCFYVHSEEIEGRVCDLVGQIVTTIQDEQRSSISYYWLDQRSHLPRAFQLHSFSRGAAISGPKWLFRDVELNVDWKTYPFVEVPEKVEIERQPLKQKGSATGREWKAGDVAPDLEIETIDIQRTSLRSQMKGRTLVTFWAPWCGPCLGELDALAELTEVREGKLKVLAISVDDSKQNAREYAKKKAFPFIVALDPDCERSHSTLTTAFGVTGIPHAFLFDTDGKLIRQWVGFSSKEELAKNLK